MYSNSAKKISAKFLTDIILTQNVLWMEVWFNFRKNLWPILDIIPTANCCSYCPSCLLAIVPIGHRAYWSSCLSAIMPKRHCTYWPSSHSIIVPISYLICDLRTSNVRPFVDCVLIWKFEFKKLAIAIAFSCQKSWF